MTDLKSPVLKLEDVAVAYKIRGGEIEAVQDVSFEIHRGETHGIVGESGCGKSTVAWAVLNFLGANGYVKRGNIKFQGQELVKGICMYYDLRTRYRKCSILRREVRIHPGNPVMEPLP